MSDKCQYLKPFDCVRINDKYQTELLVVHLQIIYIHIYIYMTIYIYIYIYTYIVIHRQTASMYHKSLVWLVTRDNFTSVGYLTPETSSFSALVKEFLRILFFIYVIGYSECRIHEKSYCVSGYMVAGKFPTRVLKPRGNIYVHTYIYIYISRVHL